MIHTERKQTYWNILLETRTYMYTRITAEQQRVYMEDVYDDVTIMIERKR